MDDSQDCGSRFRRQIVANNCCTKVGGRKNNVVSITHTTMFRILCVEKQLPILVTGMFERPLLLSLDNVKDLKCVRRYVVKLQPNPG